jgi:Folylpolyglutamate synthase
MPDEKLKIADEHSDEPFFRAWKNRRPGESRSLERARELAASLELERLAIPLLTIVGSKGKATTAVYASATLSAAGLRVGTITSPPIISNRERIRINGQAISHDTYINLSQSLAKLLDDAAQQSKEAGYLSPSGLYTLMGLRHFLDQRCDVIVLEAGMGGRSDEVSLFSPTVVAVTSIFREHADVLGPDISAIALNKIGVVRDSTKAALSLPQSSEVTEVLLHETQKQHCPLTFVEPQPFEISPKINLPDGLSRANAALGIEAAQKLLNVCGLQAASTARLQKILSTIKLPGRLSAHIDERGRKWILDAAINARGIASALEYAEREFGEIDTVLVCLPTGKDAAGAREVLGQRTFVAVSLETEHLSFVDAEWDARLIPLEELERHLKGQRILAVGTWSFIGVLLKRLEFNYETAYE